VSTLTARAYLPTAVWLCTVIDMSLSLQGCKMWGIMLIISGTVVETKWSVHDKTVQNMRAVYGFWFFFSVFWGQIFYPLDFLKTKFTFNWYMKATHNNGVPCEFQFMHTSLNGFWLWPLQVNLVTHIQSWQCLSESTLIICSAVKSFTSCSLYNIWWTMRWIAFSGYSLSAIQLLCTLNIYYQMN
jgi:hypothetical protein